jgi:hypothetical protein
VNQMYNIVVPCIDHITINCLPAAAYCSSGGKHNIIQIRCLVK